MACREYESLYDYHTRLFQERPVTQEALVEIEGLCDIVGCQQIECLVVKCLLAYMHGNAEGRGMADDRNTKDN